MNKRKKVNEYLRQLYLVMEPYDINETDINSIIAVVDGNIMVLGKGESTSVLDYLFSDYSNGESEGYVEYLMTKDEFIRCMEVNISNIVEGKEYLLECSMYGALTIISNNQEINKTFISPNNDAHKLNKVLSNLKYGDKIKIVVECVNGGGG